METILLLNDFATALLFLVVCRTTKLTNAEISRMSCRLGLDWDNISGLLNIPYYEREEIRFNFVKFSSKAEQVFRLFNNSPFFCRHLFVKCLNELGREDLIDVMLPEENKVFHCLINEIFCGKYFNISTLFYVNYFLKECSFPWNSHLCAMLKKWNSLISHEFDRANFTRAFLIS